MQRRAVSNLFQLKRLNYSLYQISFFSSETPLSVGAEVFDPLYTDIPKPRRDKSERKPYVTPMKELIRRAKEEKELRKAYPVRMLENPPDNGLLVPELVEVAHLVYRARESLICGLDKLVKVIPVQKCRFCTEIHIGHVGHEIRTCTGPGSGTRNATHVWRKGRVHDVVFFPKCYHLYDRVGKPRVVHKQSRRVPRIPAILELCMQAGVDLEKYPTKRRTKPVYYVDGRIEDFEQVMENNEIRQNFHFQNIGSPLVSDLETTSYDPLRNESEKNVDNLDKLNGVIDTREVSIYTMESWFEMISEAKKLMEKYSVLTCGYCPEVQVGPKGHKVRMCKAAKHQSRDGQHAWQEATINDLVGFSYVWHVRDLNGPPLHNNLKRYYGKAPAIVEMCVQAGAPVPDHFRSMMRLDVVPPDRDEVDLVA